MAADIATDDLRTIAHLKDVVETETKYNDYGYEIGREIIRIVDCTRVRQLARQELIRRGLKV